MPKRIVWMSRHAPTPSQLAELDRLFPGHSFYVDGRPFSDAADIVQRFREAGGDELVVVAPWTVINKIVENGIFPLVARMERVPCKDGRKEVVIGQGKRRRCFQFIRFERCKGFDMKTIPLEPTNNPIAPLSTRGPIGEQNNV